MTIKASFPAVLLLLANACGGNVAPSFGPGGSTCIDFQSVQPFPQTFGGPTFTFAPLDFHNPQRGGNPQPMILADRVEDQDNRPELNVGFSRTTPGYQPLIVNFPSNVFPGGVGTVHVELRHFASATVGARDAAGGVVSTVSQPAQDTRAFLTLQGPGITSLEFEAVETLLYQVCWM
jgi:hypothetical protein